MSPEFLIRITFWCYLESTYICGLGQMFCLPLLSAEVFLSIYL